MASKASKTDAGYVPSAKTKQCQTCKHYTTVACTKVAGAINPSGSCTEYYVKK